MRNQTTERLSLVFTIIERGHGNRLTKLYKQRQVFTHLRCEGTGTASSEIMDILGLGTSEKDIILSITPLSTARALLAALDDELRGALHGRGIAFTAPLTAINNQIASAINLWTKSEKDMTEERMEQKSSLILVTVNQGYTNEVMETARRAGARGGTVVRGRWVEGERFEQALGMSQQEEKEMLFIVVPKEMRNGVMEHINRDHGLQSEAAAMVCALGIDQLVHLE